MSAAVQLFKREGIGAFRCVLVGGEPYFVGRDVAMLLGYSNSREAIGIHVDEKDKTDGVAIIDSIGREQTPVLINESGLYSLILGSKLPKAKAFKSWVTSEVLPAIRKTGTYKIPEKTEEIVKVPFGKFLSDYLRANDKTVTEFAKASGISADRLRTFVKSANQGKPEYPSPTTVNRAAKGMCYSYDYVASRVLISERNYKAHRFLGASPRDLVAKHYDAAHPKETAKVETQLSVKPAAQPAAKPAPVSPETVFNVKGIDFSGLTSNEFIGDLLILIGKHIKAGDLR